MKFNRPLYYCSECKLIVPSLDKLLFIEDNSSKGFCSEACIEDFYFPIIRHFEQLETNLRSDLSLLTEKIQIAKEVGKEVGKEDGKEDGKEETHLVDEVLASPSEVWSVKNELNEEIFTYIKHFQYFSSVVICTVYKGEGSFIFLNTKTKSREFLEAIRKGSSRNETPFSGQDQDQDQDMDEDDFNFMQLLESKKSKLLADLLVKRKDNDISFEEFTEYEFCFQDCLETPDEVFESKDNEGDLNYIYIKSFIKGTDNIFYIISCLKRKDGEDENSVSVFPVLAFPTNDVDLYSEWRTGKKITGLIKN